MTSLNANWFDWTLGALILVAAFVSPVGAAKLDYTQHPATADDLSSPTAWAGPPSADLFDGVGAEPYPVAWGCLTSAKPPTPAAPARLDIDYKSPVNVAALAHYFYVPGNRDHRWADYLAGPAAFKEVKLYASDNKTSWTEVAHLTDLPSACPQLLKLPKPVTTRYLKLEVLAIDPSATAIRIYEIETYVDEAPASLPKGDLGKAKILGFPNAEMQKQAPVSLGGWTTFTDDKKQIHFGLAVAKLDKPLAGKINVRVNDQPVVWESAKGSVSPLSMKATASPAWYKGNVAGHEITLDAAFVRAGLKLTVNWAGPKKPPFAKVEILAAMDGTPNEWCIPEYYHSAKMPDRVAIPSAAVPTCIAIASDGRQSLTIVPNTDQSWIGLEKESVVATLPIRDTPPEVMILASEGDWFSGFEKAVIDVYDLDEPRQFSPVSQCVPDMCRALLAPSHWSTKYDSLRFFPDVDAFWFFYSIPYAVSTFNTWEILSEDPEIARKVDRIASFPLECRIKSGPMKGAIFTDYGDRSLYEAGTMPYWAPLYGWYKNYPDEQIIGSDGGCNRWITSHATGPALWGATQVWRARGKIDPKLLEMARESADWMVKYQREDGSWPYAYDETGKIVSPTSTSGAIWNIWSLYRFGKLTGDEKYLASAKKGADDFKKTFTANHLYRGYWEDNYFAGNTTLNTTQGYESSIAALAFAEMGEPEAMVGSAEDAMRYMCTRVLESRTYDTSLCGASEQQGWAPGTYITTTLGLAARLAWKQSHADIFRRMSYSAKVIGWWQDPQTGGAFWLGAAITQNPIEMYREKGGAKQFWPLWDSAQKVFSIMPWLVDEIEWRSGGRIRLNPESLSGPDDRGAQVVMREFKGKVKSSSGQVNWAYLKPADAEKKAGPELVLINHAEATKVTVNLPAGLKAVSMRTYARKDQLDRTKPASDRKPEKPAPDSRNKKIKDRNDELILDMAEKTLTVVQFEEQ